MLAEAGLKKPRVFDLLLQGTQTDRLEALHLIRHSGPEVDRLRLQLELLEALAEPVSAPSNSDVDQAMSQAARPWLFGALALLCDGNERISKLVRLHLQEVVEPDPEVRFWILRGLIYDAPADLDVILRKALEEDSLKVRQLALVALTSRGDTALGERLLTEINEDGSPRQEALLQALSVLPVRSTLKNLCDIVIAGRPCPAIDLAIMALGQAQGKRSIDTATRVLSTFLTRTQGVPTWEATQVLAVHALGNLRSHASVPTLLQQLSLKKPEISAEAFRGLVKVDGEEATITHLLEFIAKADRKQIESLNVALRRKGLDELVRQTQVVSKAPILNDGGITEDQQSTRNSSTEIEEFCEKGTMVMEKGTIVWGEADKSIRDLFDNSFREARNDFKMATIMGAIVFLLGVIMVGLSAWILLTHPNSLQSWIGLAVTGSIGILGVVYGVMTAKPRRQIQQTVEQLMYLKVIFMAYMRQLNQADQAYNRRLQEDEPVVAQDVDDFSRMVGMAMQSAVGHLTTNHPTGASRFSFGPTNGGRSQ